jgi:hypothetical protein
VRQQLIREGQVEIGAREQNVEVCLKDEKPDNEKSIEPIAGCA